MTRIRNKNDNDKIFCVIKGDTLTFHYQHVRSSRKIFLFSNQTTDDVIAHLKKSWCFVKRDKDLSKSGKDPSDELCLYVREIYRLYRNRNSRLVKIYEKIARMSVYILSYGIDENDTPLESNRSAHKNHHPYRRQKMNYTYADDDWAA